MTMYWDATDLPLAFQEIRALAEFWLEDQSVPKKTDAT